MATNQFLPFGQGSGANVLSQADWATLAARTGGFQAGTASSAAANKAWRQGALAAAALGQIIVDILAQDALDTDTPPQMKVKLLSALKSSVASPWLAIGATGSTALSIPSWANNVEAMVLRLHW